MSGDLKRELEVATELARRAGEQAVRFFRQEGLRVDRKLGDEPVTEADRSAERIILDGLRQAFPDDGVLSEEQPDRESWLAFRRAWVVDPLDGTKDFVAGRDGWSVMIGLLDRFEPVLGVVRQPTLALTYRAARGLGAAVIDREDERPLVPTTGADPAEARLVTSYSHRSPVLAEVRARLGVKDELHLGSVGLKVGLVARGARDLYVNPEGHCRLWDICAPQAIITEAGGRMTDVFGAPLSYQQPDEVRVLRGIVASNGACHGAVIEKLAPLFGEPRNLR